ncbi:MAG: HAD family hydrolase [Pseudomonadota bacterium]
MAYDEIKALTFDTGGTILDWHSGFRDAFAEVGRAHGIERDWAQMANRLRRRSLRKMINQGEHEPPTYNIDGAHRLALEELLEEHDLTQFDEQQRHQIAYVAPHSFTCWPDFVGGLEQLRTRRLCASFTILSYRLIMDTARENGVVWDAVFSCEGIGKYKMLPEPYERVAHFLQLEPAQILMVASHHFDLDAAADVGYKTAHVQRPTEWGGEALEDPQPRHQRDISVSGFSELAALLNA